MANCHAVSCMQRTCSISIEIFLKLWASKKKSFCESYLNQINIRSFESIALPVPYQDRFLKIRLGLEREQHFRQNCPSVSIPRFGPHFGCLLGHFWRHFGSPKASRTPQNASRCIQNAPKWRTKTDQNKKSHIFKKYIFPTFFNDF